MKVNWLLLVGFVVGCNLIGGIGAFWTSSDSEWYKSLNKPSFNPPSWVFGVVWTLLFSLMGVAVYLVWVAPSSKLRTVGLVLFGAQFLFNILWSYLFFGLENIGAAFVEISVLIGLILATGIYFWMVDVKAGLMIVPYFVWVLFAGVLNWWIWRLN